MLLLQRKYYPSKECDRSDLTDVLCREDDLKARWFPGRYLEELGFFSHLSRFPQNPPPPVVLGSFEDNYSVSKELQGCGERCICHYKYLCPPELFTPTKSSSHHGKAWRSLIKRSDFWVEMNESQVIRAGWKAGWWCLELNNVTHSALISSKSDLAK